MSKPTPDDSRHLSWLKEAWHKQAFKIDGLSRRWADLKKQPNTSPAFMHKLTRMLDQIAIFQEKERDIVSEIEEIEKKHRFMRQNNLLKQAEMKPANKDPHMLPENAPKPSDGFWETLAIFMVLKRLFGGSKPDPSLR